MLQKPVWVMHKKPLVKWNYCFIFL